jgi:hypothetical protein
MNVKQIVPDFLKAIFTRRPSDAFVCGDCARNARCGAEPSAQCVIRAAQINSDRRRAPKRSIFIGW